MLQFRGEHDLAAKAIDGNSRGQRLRQHLDHDFAIERVIVGEKDARHSAAAHLAFDCICSTEMALQSPQQLGVASRFATRGYRSWSHGAGTYIRGVTGYITKRSDVYECG